MKSLPRRSVALRPLPREPQIDEPRDESGHDQRHPDLEVNAEERELLQQKPADGIAVHAQW